MGARSWITALGVSAVVHGGLLLWPVAERPAPRERERVAVTIVEFEDVVARPRAMTGRIPADVPARAPERSSGFSAKETAGRPPAPTRPRSRTPSRPGAYESSAHTGEVVIEPDSLMPEDMPVENPAVPDARMAVLPAAPALLPSGGVAPPAPPPARADPAAYAEQVRALLARHKHYPERARRRGWQGETVLVLAIAADGGLAGEPRVSRTSGFAELDREAVRMARRAAPFPASGAAGTLELTVPVHFSVADASR